MANPIVIEGTIRFDEFVAGSRDAFHGRVALAFAVVCLPVGLVLWGFGLGSKDYPLSQVGASCSGVGLWFWVARVLMRRKLLKEWASNAAAALRRRVEIDEDGVRTTDGEGNARVSEWGSCAAWLENKKVFVVRLKSKERLILVKRLMSGDEIRRVQTLLQQKLQGRKG